MKNFDRAYFGAQLLAAIYWGDRLVWPDEAPSLVAPTVALTVSPTEDIHVGDTVTVQIALTGVPMPTMSEVTISATIDGTPITLSGTGAARTWVATQAGELIVAATVSTAAGSAEATVSSEIAVPDQLSIVFEPDVLRVGVPVTLTVMLGDEPTAPTMIAAMLNGSPVALTGTGPTRSLTPASEGTLQVSVDLTGSESISVSLPVEMARPAFYPDVPPVDLTKATGSVKFPDNNWEPGIIRAGAPELKGMINQSRTNFNRPGAGTPQAFAAVVRLPIERRKGGTFWGIFGSASTGANLFSLRLGQPYAGTAARRFNFKRSGLGDLSSQIWSEDAALVVGWYDGVESCALDWYSLRTGERFAGDVTINAAVTSSAGSTGFGIGKLEGLSSFTTPTNSSTPLWPGEIEALWNVVGVHVTPEQWTTIALGEKIQDVVPVANLNYVREPGDAGMIVKPTWATFDTTLACTLPTDATETGTTLLCGSSFRRQSRNRYVTLEEHAGGHVHGLKRGETERMVTFKGRATGPVEIRVYERGTGRVVVDWTLVASPSSGEWSGSIMLPKGKGYYFADARLQAFPLVIAYGRAEFGVGYKFVFMSQSQTSIAVDLATQRVPLEPAAKMNVTMAELRKNGTRPSPLAREPVMGYVGLFNDTSPRPSYVGDGLVTFANQFRRLEPDTPVMIYHETTGGTSFAGLLNGGVDADTDRQWADFQDKLDRWGNDVTAVIFNWLITETSPTLEYLEDGFLIEHAGHKLYSVAAALQPGWTFISMPSDRRRDSEGYARAARRAIRTDFVHTYAEQGRPFFIGPNVSDYRISNNGDGHPGKDVNEAAAETFETGPARMMQRFGVGALIAIGRMHQDEVLPYYANARLSPDATQIWVDVIAVNGGEIYSPAPNNLRSWQVYEAGDSGATPFSPGSQPGIDTVVKGYSCVLNTSVDPPRVEITRSSGTFAAETYVYRVDDGEKRASGDGAAEDAIHAGGIYERWHGDALANTPAMPSYPEGFPVIGMRDGANRWRNRFETRVKAQVAVGSLSAALSAATSGTVITLAEGNHGNISIKNKAFDPPLVINGNGTLGDVELQGVRGLVLEGIAAGTVDAAWFSSTPSARIYARGCELARFAITGVDRFGVEGNRFQGGPGTVAISSGKRGIVRANRMSEWVRHDGLRILGNSQFIVVDRNYIHDHAVPSELNDHGDCIQLFGSGGFAPSDITIRRNVLRDRPPPRNGAGKMAQGIFIANPENPAGAAVGFLRLTIEENLIDVAVATALDVSGARGGQNEITRNTLRPAMRLDDATKRATLTAESGSIALIVRDNLVQKLTDSASATVLVGNVQYGTSVVFPDWTGGLADFLPLEEAGIPDSVGATTWLRTLLPAA